jgi:phosphatidylglycerophosphate synthase
MLRRPSRAHWVTSTRIVCAGLTLIGLPNRWPSSSLLAIVLAAWLSDLTDGWIARRDNTQSRFGAALDQWADALFHAATALGWILASSDDNSLLLAAVWLHCLGSAMNPVAFPSVTIAFPAMKVIGGGLAFAVDVLLASKTIGLVPTEILIAASTAAFLFRVIALVGRVRLERFNG